MCFGYFFLCIESLIDQEAVTNLRPCTMRPYGLVNSECPLHVYLQKGKKQQVSDFNQKPGYVKGRLTTALIVNILCSIENLQCAYS